MSPDDRPPPYDECDWDAIDTAPQTPDDVPRPRGYSALEAATIGGCHPSTISRLAHEKILHGRRRGTGGRSPWVILSSRAQIREAVTEHAPKSGFKVDSHAHTPARRYRYAEREPVAPPLPPPHTPSALAPVLEWTQLEGATRLLLLQLAKKFSVADLKILTEL